MPSIHQVLFLAAIPQGHQVLVISFASEDKSPTVVLDRTT